MTQGKPQPEGEIILIDKDLDWTSFDVVKKVRNLVNVKKVGHAGTLDPLATGLLILCTGKNTKKINTFQDQAKEYTGTILLGKTTPSYDLETEYDSETDYSHLTTLEVNQTVKGFLGEITQRPPIYSALKIGGKRSYDLARAGKKVEIKTRQVQVAEFEITKVDLPKVSFRIKCSKGTYIRSIAHDFGAALKVGGCLIELRRTKIGEFDVKNAQRISDFEIERRANNDHTK